MVVEKGPTTSSHLLIRNARQQDSGIYTCSPLDMNTTAIHVHVLDGELDMNTSVIHVHVWDGELNMNTTVIHVHALDGELCRYEHHLEWDKFCKETWWVTTNNLLHQYNQWYMYVYCMV